MHTQRISPVEKNLPYAGGPIVAVISTAAQSQLIKCDWAAVPGTATIKCVALCLVNNEERCSLFNQLILGRAKNRIPTYLILMAYSKDRPYILKSWKNPVRTSLLADLFWHVVKVLFDDWTLALTMQDLDLFVCWWIQMLVRCLPVYGLAL